MMPVAVGTSGGLHTLLSPTGNDERERLCFYAPPPMSVHVRPSVSGLCYTAVQLLFLLTKLA